MAIKSIPFYQTLAITAIFTQEFATSFLSLSINKPWCGRPFGAGEDVGNISFVGRHPDTTLAVCRYVEVPVRWGQNRFLFLAKTYYESVVFIANRKRH